MQNMTRLSKAAAALLDRKHAKHGLAGRLVAASTAAVLLLPAASAHFATHNTVLAASPAKANVRAKDADLTIPEGSSVGRSIRVNIRDTATLESRIHRHYAGVELSANPQTPIPNLIIDNLPHDFAQVMPIAKRKQLFVQSVLPLILLVNEKLKQQRARLQALSVQESTAPDDQRWIADLASRYGLINADQPKPYVPSQMAKKLLLNIDVIPVSLALSQAAAESGWGRSRFARQGNALFGQWTEDGERGLLPLQRDSDKRHFVRAFPDLLSSVDSYMRNLNSHPAYSDFRAARAVTRRLYRPFDSVYLAGYLNAYSERGRAYIDELRTIIRVNKFNALDNSKLHRPTAI